MRLQALQVVLGGSLNQEHRSQQQPSQDAHVTAPEIRDARYARTKYEWFVHDEYPLRYELHGSYAKALLLSEREMVWNHQK
jgi:hypothetical protein